MPGAQGHVDSAPCLSCRRPSCPPFVQCPTQVVSNLNWGVTLKLCIANTLYYDPEANVNSDSIMSNNKPRSSKPYDPNNVSSNGNKSTRETLKIEPNLSLTTFTDEMMLCSL